MLPPHQRLRSNGDFQRVYRTGRSWAHPLVILHVLGRPEGKRLGISAGKKVGKAVDRNRVRRRVREAVRARIGDWKEGFDAVVVVRPAAALAEFVDIGEAIEELARRSRLVREPEAAPDSLYTMPAGGRGRPARDT